MPDFVGGPRDRDGFASGRNVYAVTGFKRQEVDVVVTVEGQRIDALDGKLMR